MLARRAVVGFDNRRLCVVFTEVDDDAEAVIAKFQAARAQAAHDDVGLVIAAIRSGL